MSMLKLSVSGSYLKDGSSKDYQFNDIVMPKCPDEYVQMNAFRRAVPMRLIKDNMSFDHIRSCYVDDVVEIDGKPSFVGKTLKTLNAEEAQDVAIAYTLFEVPLYKQTELRDVREKLYKTYAKNVLNEEVFDNEFDFKKAQDIEIAGNERRKRIKVVNNKEYLDNLDKENKKESL